MPHTVSYKNYEHHTGTRAQAMAPSKETAQALARAETICRAHGVRLTTIRRTVLEALYSSQKPLGAYELADLLASNARRMAPITVYRALDFLIEQGLAHRLASRNAYISTLHDDGSQEATAYLICDGCGTVEPASSAAFAGALSDLLARADFEPRAKVLEVAGHCSRCQGHGHGRH
ncbi:Fur family transcriptional regulator [Microvirga sp. GCM10011540]|uniref:Fur family transcriptional regulator n=1 Tax=Microvirga sp. GCM10011540 TaxID=3317338 RepID=UPI00360EFCE1